MISFCSRLALSLSVCLLAQIGASTANAASRPNIIVFYTDDHGYADLGLHGIVKDIQTPHLDALARSGVLAKHGYSTAPQCVPSRAGLLTGRFQARFGLESNVSPLDGFNRQITIASRLQQAGYATAQFGKWHLGPTTDIPQHGFNHVFSQNAQNSFSANLTLDGKDRPMGLVAPTHYHIDACSKAAAAVIDRYSDSPFFLYIAYRAPHTPLDAPPHYKERFPGPMPERRRAALGMLSAIDDGVGLITDTLKRLHLTEKTLVFFMSDNGAPLKIHRTDSPLQGDPGGWDGSLNDPLNGEKGMLSEGGIHVPFIVSWPGTLPAGKSYPHPVSALDIAATAAAIAHLQVSPDQLDGTNLIPHLTGENPQPPHEFLAWRWIAQSAIRAGQWKLLRGGDREYLYDLSTDLEEKQNLAAQHPDIANRLRQQLKTWSDQLEPPGFTTGPMAQTWLDYFDHYLEGKTIPNRPSAPPSLLGWQTRNGSSSLKNQALVIQPIRSAQRSKAFITHPDLNLPGPITAQITFHANQSGTFTFAWRTKDDKDFSSANQSQIDYSAQQNAQTLELELPIPSRLIHLRLHPSQPDGLRIQSIQLKGAQGKTSQWDFTLPPQN
jgi:arylsulfatase A-like enzyme